MQRGLQQADSRLLSLAQQGHYIEPRKLQIIVFYALVGAVIAAAWLFLRQFAKRGIMLPKELEMFTNRPVVGEIPLLPFKRRSKLLNFLNESRTSMVAEAFRNLRTSLLLSNLDKQPQLIMMTSSLPAEGKTTNSISLAHNLADLGKRVLLMECDIRRRTLSLYFDVPDSQEGILGAMTSGRPLEEFLVRDPRLGADVLLGERTNSSASDVFSSEVFANFLQSLRQRYDFVIIDTPPVLIASDARIIGQQVDAVLYTVAWDQTTQNEVQQGLRLLRMVNVQVDGMVLTMINPKGLKRYGYGYGYSAYDYRKSGYFSG